MIQYTERLRIKKNKRNLFLYYGVYENKKNIVVFREEIYKFNEVFFGVRSMVK